MSNLDNITGHVLDMVNQARVTKRTHPDGTWALEVDHQPTPPNSNVHYAMTTIIRRELAQWWQCGRSVEVALITILGFDTLDRWEADLLGLTPPPTSSRPLTHFDLGLSERQIKEFHARFAAFDQHHKECP